MGLEIAILVRGRARVSSKPSQLQNPGPELFFSVTYGDKAEVLRIVSPPESASMTDPALPSGSGSLSESIGTVDP